MSPRARREPPPPAAPAADAAEAAEAPPKGFKICVDRSLPPELQGQAFTRAIDENPKNVVAPEAVPGLGFGLAALDGPAIALVAKKLWQPGRTLRVRFLDGPPEVRARIAAVAQEWAKHANVRFSFGADSQAEIRIACRAGLGSWSYIGTDALTVPRKEPTMNFGWLTPTTSAAEYSRVVLHEFGHALGAIHEHQNPLGNIPWNREAVYRFYMGPPNSWSRAQVDVNMFQKYARTSTNASTYDPKSIMHYAVPRQLTLGGFEVGWNRALSARDKEFIRRQYP